MKLNEILGVTPRLCHELANKKRNVAREFGFTLAEMMVVMLIMSIIMAAMAPVMTTRMKNDNSSPWKWCEDKVNAYFGNSDKQIAMIGQRTVGTNENNAKLIIRANNDRPNHILFKKGNNIVGNLRLDTNNRILLGKLANETTQINNSVAIGNNVRVASGIGSIVIGDNAQTSSFSSNIANIAIGSKAQVIGHTDHEFTPSVALGANAKSKLGGISIGNNAGGENGSRGISIGAGAEGSGIAIGVGTKGAGTIVGTGSNVEAGNGQGIVYGSSISLTGLSKIGSNIAIGSGFTSHGNQNIVIWSHYNYGSALVTKGDDNVVIGSSATTVTGTGDEATGASGTVAIGKWAKALAADGVAIRGVSRGVRGIAIGTGHDVEGTGASGESIAIGQSASAASGSIAMGAGNTIQYHAIAGGVESIAIGRVARSSGHYSVAIGKKAQCSGVNSVCLGAGATTDHANYIELGTSASTVNIQGSLKVAGVTVTPSDSRLKYVGKENLDGLAKIRALKPYNYTFKKDETKTPRVGVMAQDLQKVFPNAVKKGADGFLTIRMEDMFYALINAVKELDAKVTTLTNEVRELRKENKEIMQKLKALETHP